MIVSSTHKPVADFSNSLSVHCAFSLLLSYLAEGLSGEVVMPLLLPSNLLPMNITPYFENAI
jgi:hypothetical protein